MPYLRFLFQHRRLLCFGVLTAFAASFGQTFFISLFSGEIRATFQLSHGEFGMIYSGGTLASAACLMWIGRGIDVLPLRLFTALAGVGLALACLAMAFAPWAAALYGVIFGLRLMGQGLMSHISVVAMLRHFTRRRGTAVSVASLGFPLGEAVFPLAGVAGIALLGWQQTWSVGAAVIVLVLLPLLIWLLSAPGLAANERPAVAPTSDPATPHRRQWTRGQVLRDPRFHLILPTVLMPAIISTGIFFHQVFLVESKGWSLGWFASTYIAFAIAKILATLATGPLIDRLTARRLLPYFLAPLAMSLAVLAAFSHPLTALLFMILAGISAGIAITTLGALWAELYGVAHLGAIRALAASVSVFGSAISPVGMGWLIDAEVSFGVIATGGVVAIVISSVLSNMAVGRFEPAGAEASGE